MAVSSGISTTWSNVVTAGKWLGAFAGALYTGKGWESFQEALDFVESENAAK